MWTKVEMERGGRMKKMDYRASIDWLYDLKHEIRYDEQGDAIDIAVDCIHKQISKKPIKDGVDRMCPICGCDVGYVDAMCNVKFKYCTECGQRIDWSEAEVDK